MKSKGKGCHLRTLVCRTCEKQFISNPKPAKNYFCSHQCYTIFKRGEGNPNWKGGGIEKICKVCSKPFVIGKAQLKYKGYGSVCSLECRDRLFILRGKVTHAKRKIDNQVKSLLNNGLKGTNHYKKCKDILGYSGEEFKKHIENLFKEGMTWANHGRWHIDHVIPKRSFDYSDINDPKVRECWALSNLKPIWAEENLKKGSYLIE